MRRILLSISIAGLALGVSGQEVSYGYLAVSLACITLFCVMVIGAKQGIQSFESSHINHSGILTALCIAAFIYAQGSSLITFSESLDYTALISTAPFILFPISFVVFQGIALSNEQWEAIDVEKVCIYSALIFCMTLIINSPSEFTASITDRSRFTWTEFRAVNPLPVIAATLLAWRHGFKAVFRPDFMFLAVYIYATKYVNWMALILIAFPLKYIIGYFARTWFSMLLVGFIVILNTVIAVYWRDAIWIAPSELDRIYEVRLAYDRWLESPLLGAGFGTAFDNASYDQKYSMHNLFAYLLSFGGLFGIFLFGAIIMMCSRLHPGRSEFIMIIYLILTATAASFKLPAVQFYMGLAFAAMSAYSIEKIRSPSSRSGIHKVGEPG